jgi:predicted membrane chloride channel (bestrophin family)
MDKIKMFLPMLKFNFFIKSDREIYKLLDSIYEDIIPFEKHIAPPAVVRLKNEQANIRKLLSRIEVIKKTDFIPSVFVSLKAISVIFLAVYCLLTVETWWVGVLLISIFTFVIFSIIFLISNMEDPFEYEISLAILDQLKEDIEKTI